jgi:hypothetical protein
MALWGKTDATGSIPKYLTAADKAKSVFVSTEEAALKTNKDKGITGLPNMRFHVTNSMTLPGDCLLDYMTSTRYGAGIPREGIYDE